MKSPFKFLDAFTLSDRDVFFGREEATKKLYSLVFKSPLVMVYGLSGTGKTSLIQCGLASRFDGPDWFPFFIRRGKNINRSLHEALDFYLEDDETSLSLIGKILFLYGEYLSPVYLIFDQLEELFILGSKEEQEEFIYSIRELIDAGLACRIILVMREEYLGHLYDFEQVIPSVFDFRLRVEPMNSSGVKAVMRSSFAKFNISLEPPEEDRLQQMVDNIAGEKFGVQLPYLQVYLDMLYRQDYARTYGLEKQDVLLPELTFTKEEIDELGRIDDVLEKFIQEQSRELQEELSAQYSSLPKDTVVRVMDAFVSEEGTKVPILYTRQGDFIAPEAKFTEWLHSVPADALSDCINGLEKRRILRFSDNTIELAHDSLAALIDQKRSEQQRQLNQVLRRIKNSYVEYRDNEVFLTEKQLNVYEEFIPLLDLDDQLLAFIDSSKVEVARLKKVEEEQKKAMVRKRLFPLIATLAVLALMASVIAFIQRDKAVQAKDDLARATIKTDSATIVSFKRQGNYSEAIERLDEVEMKINSLKLTREMNTLKSWIQDQRENYRQIQWHVNLGDSLLAVKTDLTDTSKVAALREYDQALSIEADSLISQKKKNLEQLIKQRADLWLSRARIYIQFGDSKGRLRTHDALHYVRMLDLDSTYVTVVDSLAREI